MEKPISRRSFIVASLAAATPGCKSPHAQDTSAPKTQYTSTPPQSSAALPPVPEDEITKPHPLEAIAKNIKPNVRLCVIDEGEWIDKITNGAGFTTSNLEEIKAKITAAARDRVLKYFPESEHDHELKESLMTLIGLHDSETVTVHDSHGNPYCVMVLGSLAKTPNENLKELLSSDSLAQKAADSLQSRHLNPFKNDKSKTMWHELAHVFYPLAEPKKADKHKTSYQHHKAEIVANAFEELKDLQQNGNLELTRVYCDLTTLYAFYGSTTYEQDLENNQISTKATFYFSHKLFDTIKKAYDASPDHFKNTTDAELLTIAHHIAEDSIYSEETFSEITESFVKARNKLLKLPPDSFKDKGENVMIYLSNANEPDINIPPAAEALRLNLLNRNKPYVMELLRAEARILGLQKNLTP